MRLPSLIVLAVAAALAIANVYTTLHRSLIPVSLNDRIGKVEVRLEKHIGIDDVSLLHAGDRVIHIDNKLAKKLDKGDWLRKGRWSRKLEVSGKKITLGTSSDFKGMLVAMPIILALVLMALYFPRRSA